MVGIPDSVWQNALAEINTRASRDAAFRQRCLDDAHGVIEEITGRRVPAGGAPVRFVERIKEQVFVLPPLRAKSDALSERQLEDVVGGLANTHPGHGTIVW